MFPIFPWFPPGDVDVDSARWVEVLRGFEYFNPTVIVPGHGDLGDFRIARNLAAHIEFVGQEVRAFRQAGRAPDQIIAELKPRIIAAYPGWENPNLLDWEIGYFAAQPT